LKLLVPADSLVQLGQPVAIIGEKGEDISKLVPAGGGAPAASTPKNGESKDAKAPASDEARAKGATPSADRGVPEQPPGGAPGAGAPAARTSGAPGARSAPSQGPGASADANHVAEGGSAPDGRLRASPYVRKVARERNIDLSAVSGSGPHGRIVARDLE